MILVFLSNDEAVKSLAAEITEISAAKEMRKSGGKHQEDQEESIRRIRRKASRIVSANKKYNNTQNVVK